MLSSIWMASVLATTVLAAPSGLAPTGVDPTSLSIVTDYFEALSNEVQTVRANPPSSYCDVSQATLPTDVALPPVSSGLYLKHVALGRGTQNYTCSTTNSSAPPAAIGAKATLYNATCIAASYPSILRLMPNLTLQWNLASTDQAQLYPVSLDISGHHFFETLTTPFFDLDADSALPLGTVPCAKNASASAPPAAAKGQAGSTGDGAVAWLKLVAREDATGGLAEVYRVNTAGGMQPATCAGMPAAFEVQYAAEYWFYASS